MTDYLTIKEINARTIKAIRHDMLYRTHVALHKDAVADADSKKITKAHKIVADEMKARGLIHHAWDKLDNVYTNS